MDDRVDERIELAHPRDELACDLDRRQGTPAVTARQLFDAEPAEIIGRPAPRSFRQPGASKGGRSLAWELDSALTPRRDKPAHSEVFCCRTQRAAGHPGDKLGGCLGLRVRRLCDRLHNAIQGLPAFVDSCFTLPAELAHAAHALAVACGARSDRAAARPQLDGNHSGRRYRGLR
jgi:hypothetical protein